MRIRKILLSIGIIGIVSGVLGSGLIGPALAEDTSVSEGTVKTVSVAIEGANAGMVYFDIEPTESGAPSSFKMDGNNSAAVHILIAARAGNFPIKITHKDDFTVVEIEF